MGFRRLTLIVFTLLLGLLTFPLLSKSEEIIKPKNGSQKEESPPTGIKSVAIVTDPLAWLTSTLSCDDLIEQVKVRYEPLGKYSELPRLKREEVDQVLSAACSERFDHCQFKHCKAGRPGEVRIEVATPPGDSDSNQNVVNVLPRGEVSAEEWVASEKKLKELVDEYRKKEQALISKAMKLEKEQGLSWHLFTAEEPRAETVKESAVESSPNAVPRGGYKRRIYQGFGRPAPR